MSDFHETALQHLTGYFGSRELVHTFRQRTLVLIKALILQKRVCSVIMLSKLSSETAIDHVLWAPCRTAMHLSVLADITHPWYGFRVHIPLSCSLPMSVGLLQTLQDSGSPPLANRAPTLTRPTELRTSDRRSMMAYTGLPLDIFGKVLEIHRRDRTRTEIFVIGCVFPAIYSTSATRHDERDKELALWLYQLHRDSVEGGRPPRQCMASSCVIESRF